MVYIARYIGYDPTDEEVLGVYDTIEKAKAAVLNRIKTFDIEVTWVTYSNTTTEFAEDESADPIGAVDARPVQ